MKKDTGHSVYRIEAQVEATASNPDD
jgi:hypothetical protein